MWQVVVVVGALLSGQSAMFQSDEKWPTLEACRAHVAELTDATRDINQQHVGPVIAAGVCFKVPGKDA